MITEKDIELIDKYLFGSLSDEENEQFKSRYQDPEFISEIDFLRSVSRAALKVEKEELQNTLKIISKEYHESGTINSDLSQKSHKSTYLKIAAAVIILACIASVIFLLIDPKPEKQFSENIFNKILDESEFSRQSFSSYFLPEEQLGFSGTDSSQSRIITVYFVNNVELNQHYYLTDSCLYLFCEKPDTIRFIETNFHQYIYFGNSSDFVMIDKALNDSIVYMNLMK